MIFAGILAGGVGSRMGRIELPKQFLLLGNKPIIIHTIEKFLLNLRFDYIYIGVPKEWKLYLEDLIVKYIGINEKLIIVQGGTDRNETIMNIIDNLNSRFGEKEENIIVTHDAVRPFVTSKIIDKNIEKCLEVGACDTVISAIDTIVVSEDRNKIKSIPNREYLYQGQTPQTFRVNLLKKLYNKLNENEKKELTDACKICVVKNYPVYLVEGSIENLKITTPGDYKIAKAMIGAIND